jgi:segregation and condensation protein B
MEKRMPDTEKDLETTLADQLEALTNENAVPADTSQESSEVVGIIDASALGEVAFETEEETSLERISEMTAALARLASEGKLEEAHLNFIDGPSDSVDESTAMDLILKSLPSSHGDAEESSHGDELPENPMIVGEAEQLPMLGLEETAPEEEEEVVPDEPTEFVDNDKLISVIESLLFATDKPVSIATMKVLFKGSNIRTRDIQRALDGLASSYAASDRGVSLEEIHGGYQLRTKVDNTDFLKRLAKVRPFRLSGPALEVLAIAAYKQPITKTEVDQIRGVESGHLMRALMERGMVGFGEKSDLPGRPMTYVTTRKFLETFGLRNLKELPTLAEIDQLLPEGIGAEEEKETLSSVTDAMANQIGSTYSESQEELDDISESLKVIDTTSEFFEQEKIRQRVERDEQKAQDIRDKLAFGDEVEDKDRRWLSRFEAKQEQIAQAAQAGETAGPLIVEEDGEAPFVAKAEATSEDESVSDELAALSAEGIGSAPEGDDEDMTDELATNPDFDDDESADGTSRDRREDVEGDV